MTTIIDIDHDTGDLTQYTSTVTDSGDLSVSTNAAMGGSSYGMVCLIDDATSIYCIKDLGSSNTSGSIEERFYFNPNSLSMPAYSYFVPTRLFNGSGSAILICYVTYTGSAYQLKVGAYNDSASLNQTSYYNINNGINIIEFKMTKSSGANDGTLLLYINGTLKETVSSIDNDTRFASFRYARLGAEYISSASISGTFYLDELILNDAGTYIGGVAYSLTCSSGPFTLTGQSASLLANRTLSAGQGSYTLTGIDATLTYSALTHYILECAQGSFSLTGQNAGLIANRKLTTEYGSFTLSGQDIGLLANRLLTAGYGSYILTGQDISLLTSRLLTAENGAYTLSGKGVGLLASRLLGAVCGTYTLTGNDVVLLYTLAIIATRHLTLRTRSTTIALEERSMSTNLQTRSISNTIEDRDINHNLHDRTIGLTLEEL